MQRLVTSTFLKKMSSFRVWSRPVSSRLTSWPADLVLDVCQGCGLTPSCIDTNYNKIMTRIHPERGRML